MQLSLGIIYILALAVMIATYQVGRFLLLSVWDVPRSILVGLMNASESLEESRSSSGRYPPESGRIHRGDKSKYMIR